ncbi:CHAT domain-containing protein [Candidatus Parabeggiatoa sp. HSG14]|uniref:CHAT domain-containing protein n=1 Tax=Candidatus Parabeggiatoa sp. HSG14 TaxID=3055593 RepID=UPI0025A8472C|nr:CHAT domain-containing protein [Thiotrichales bacterium HSG14]
MKNKFLISLCFIVTVSTTALAAEYHSLSQIQYAFEQGKFADTIKQYQNIRHELSPTQQIDTLLLVATAYQSLGLAEKSFTALYQALSIAQHQGDKIRKALVFGSLSDLYLVTRDLDKAEKYAVQSVKFACEISSSDTPLACATALNYQGNVLSIQGNDQKALESYQKSFDLAQQTNDKVLSAKLLTNIVQIEFEQIPNNLPLLKGGLKRFNQALSQMQTLPNSYDKVFGFLKLGYLAIELPKMKQVAYQVLQKALQLAKKLSNTQGEAYAKGYLGRLYEKEGRYAEAERLTRQAIFLTAQNHAPDMLYLWQWQLGRLRNAQNDLEGAIIAYQQAVKHLKTIRHAMMQGYRNPYQSFSETTDSVYFDLADLWLQLAHHTPNEKQRQEMLLKARNTLELLKTVELENYFQDDCVTKLKEKAESIDKFIDARTAVLYPIIFAERVELLLSLSDGYLKQFSVPTKSSLRNKIINFSQALEYRKKDRSNFYRRVLPTAKALYTVFIAPIATELKARQIDTLIIVPDKLLRTIPFASLYDKTEKKFLIEKYALAITPGLTLTEASQTVKRDNINILMAGLSEAVQDFPRLPHALKTIEAIETHKICPNISFTALKNDNFLKNNVKEHFQKMPYRIAYFSTHGKFENNPKNSFVLAYDKKLNMDDLEKVIRFQQFKTPVELLTLSACETAVGDERAALGLVGVAVKAGAKSAVASLWQVNDQSTAQLMEMFFRELCNNPTLPKVKAFQIAQKALLKKYKEYPFHWAPFLLIGNWF